MSAPSSELAAFHQFVSDQLAAATTPITPEDCLELWRSQNPTQQELRESTTVIQQAIDAMNNGDQGVSARDLLDQARQKHGLA